MSQRYKMFKNIYALHLSHLVSQARKCYHLIMHVFYNRLCHLISIVAPSGVKWTYHVHYTGSCIALTFMLIKLATKRNLLVNSIAAGT